VERGDVAADAGGGDRAEMHDGIDALVSIADGRESVHDLAVIREVHLHEVRAADPGDVHADDLVSVCAEFPRDDAAELAR